MSYAYKGEKIFARQNPKYSDCSPPQVKRSDHRLKRFYSTFDRRAWDVCDLVRYQHFYELVSGSQVIAKSFCRYQIAKQVFSSLLSTLLANKIHRNINYR